MTVEDTSKDWEVVTMPRIVWASSPADTEIPVPKRVRYRIMPLVILGYDLWVGVAVDELYDDRAIMKTVLNRDVAAHLGAYR